MLWSRAVSISKVIVLVVVLVDLKLAQGFCLCSPVSFL